MKSDNYTSLNQILGQTDFIWHLKADIISKIEEEAERDGEVANFDSPFYSKKLEAETKSRVIEAFAQYGINL